MTSTEVHALQLACKLSKPEVIFMKRLTLQGIKFDFQVAIGCYVADFVFPDKMLIIEVDGKSHNWTVDYDKERDGFLTQAGFTVWRIKNQDVENWPLIEITSYKPEQGPRTYLQAIQWARVSPKPRIKRPEPKAKVAPVKLPIIIRKYLNRQDETS